MVLQSARSLRRAPGGFVFYIYLLAPYVLLDHLGVLCPLQAVVGVNLVFELGSYLPVVVEGGAFLHVLVVGRDNQAAIGLAYLDHLPWYEGGAGAEEAHLHPDVLGLVILVHEEVVDLADHVAVWVVDRVAGESVFFRRELVAAPFHVCLHRRVLVTYVTTPNPLCGTLNNAHAETSAERLAGRRSGRSPAP